MEQAQARERLTAADVRFIALCILGVVVLAGVTISLFPQAFPEASIEFKAGRPEARKIAGAWLGRVGVSTGGDHFAGTFDADEEQKVFLERTLGLKEANRVYAEEVKLWRWQLRWFRPLRKEEVRVAVTPAGEVVGFRRELSEESPGARLDAGEARRRAEDFLVSHTPFRPDQLTFIESSHEERPARRDHSLVWEKTGWKVGEATFRIQVDVLGDSVGLFRQSVKVPEAWSRDYGKLRSRNTTAGVVASMIYILTGIGALYHLIRFARLGDIPWRFVGAFSLTGAALTTLNELNSIPIALAAYETTQSFPSFIATRILLSILLGIATGMWIALFAAAGEPLYRRRLGHVPSLSRYLTPRGAGTRSFFRGILLGYLLTAFFMAYQAVFYVVAARMGAWAPAEIPYSNLLNTQFPWIAVLLIGFLPAVTEEFSNRMFAIPFYETLVKSPLAAILLAGFAWGFLHAGYPNQPFYIRGVEVGVAGVAIGLMMFRYGLFPLLVWHFTVDALYTSLLLLRSGNTYFVVSGAVCAGFLLVPLVLSIVMYVRRRGFEPEWDLTNAAHGHAPEALEPPPVPEAAGVASRPAGRRLTAAMLLSLVLAGAFLAIPTNYPPRDLKYPLTSGEAEQIARHFVRQNGSDPDSYHVVTHAAEGFDSYSDERDNLPPYVTSGIATRYVSETGGLSAWRRLVGQPVPGSVFTSRFVRPLSEDEWSVVMDPRTRRVIGFSHRIPEALAGADPGEDRARTLADSLMKSMGYEAGWTPAVATSKKEPNRRDWTFVYDDSGSAVGQAVPRLTVVLRGEKPGGLGVTLKIPESYERSRSRSTLLSTLLWVVRVAVLGTLLGLIVVELVRSIRRRPFPWGRLIRLSMIAAAPIALFQINRIPLLLQRYPSEVPWNLFLVSGAVGLTLGTVLQLLLVLALLILLEVALPSWRSQLRRSAWPAQAAHGVTVALLALALGVWADRLELLGRLRWPHLFPGPTPPGLPGNDSLVPFYDVFWSSVTGSFLVGALIAGLGLVLGGSLRRTSHRWIAAVLVAVSLGPDHVRSVAEAVVPTLFLVLALGLAFAVGTRASRGNILVYVAVLPLVLGGQKALVLLQEPAAAHRLHGGVAFLLLASPLLTLAVVSLTRRREKSMAAVGSAVGPHHQR